MAVHRTTAVNDVGHGIYALATSGDRLAPVLKIDYELNAFLSKRLLGGEAFRRRIILSCFVLPDLAQARVLCQSLLTELERLGYRHRLLAFVGILPKNKTSHHDDYDKRNS